MCIQIPNDGSLPLQRSLTLPGHKSDVTVVDWMVTSIYCLTGAADGTAVISLLLQQGLIVTSSRPPSVRLCFAEVYLNGTCVCIQIPNDGSLPLQRSLSLPGHKSAVTVMDWMVTSMYCLTGAADGTAVISLLLQPL